MAEIWFDPQEVRLLSTEEIDQPAVGSSHAAVLKLGSLLLDADFPYQPGVFPIQEAKKWTRDDCATLGRIALSAIQEERDENTAITSDMLRRLYVMGVGPLPSSYFAKKRFRDMHEFKTTIGSPLGYTPRGIYDDWPIDKFIGKAEELAAKLGRKPRLPEYATLAKEGGFPSIYVLQKLVGGGISALNECLGYPDIRRWDKDRFIDFGADFIEVNGLDIFKYDAISILSRRRRGPGYSRIIARFDDWQSYKAQAIQRFEERGQTRQRKLYQYKSMIAAGTLPYEALPDDELLQRGARQLLVDSLLPRSTQSMRFSISAHHTPKKLMREILRSRPTISPGEVEIEAEILGVADDIWIRPSFKHTLVITEADLEEEGQRRRDRVERWRGRKQTGKIGTVALE